MVNRISHRNRLFIAIAISALGLTFASVGRADAPTEYDIKAAYLFNFGKFVQWPAGSPQAESSTFTIGIVGDDPFGTRLEKLLSGKTLQGKSILLQHVHTPEEAARCAVVFVSPKEDSGSLLNTLIHMPVLTVGDNPAFVDAGGIIGFHVVGDRVRFDVNLPAAEQARLKISSDLLRVAKRVRGGPTQVGL